STLVCTWCSLPVGLDPDGLDDALAGHSRPFACALHAATREGLEQAEDELVAGEVERSLEGRARFLPALVTRSRGRQPKLVLGYAGPEAFGCVEHTGRGRARRRGGRALPGRTRAVPARSRYPLARPPAEA